MLLPVRMVRDVYSLSFSPTFRYLSLNRLWNGCITQLLPLRYLWFNRKLKAAAVVEVKFTTPSVEGRSSLDLKSFDKEFLKSTYSLLV